MIVEIWRVIFVTGLSFIPLTKDDIGAATGDSMNHISCGLNLSYTSV